MDTRKIEVIEIPNMDTSFIELIMQGGITDSGIISHGHVFHQHTNEPQLSDQELEERLERCGIDLEQLKKWTLS